MVGSFAKICSLTYNVIPPLPLVHWKLLSSLVSEINGISTLSLTMPTKNHRYVNKSIPQRIFKRRITSLLKHCLRKKLSSLLKEALWVSIRIMNFREHYEYQLININFRERFVVAFNYTSGLKNNKKTLLFPKMWVTRKILTRAEW